MIWRHQKATSACGIPFVSLLVKDACFQAEESRKICNSGEGTATERTNQMVDSFMKVAEPLSYLMKRRQDLPELTLNEELSRFIQSPLLNEDLLYLGSFKTEAPSNSYEKNAYKQLKQKLK